MENREILRAAIAVAVADGELRRSEEGVLQGLALKAGVGQASFQAMVDAAEQGDDRFADRLLISKGEPARRALELLVAQAKLDGDVTEDERSVLVRIATDLGIHDDEFQVVYRRGVERAVDIRRRKSPGSAESA